MKMEIWGRDKVAVKITSVGNLKSTKSKPLFDNLKNFKNKWIKKKHHAMPHYRDII